MNKHTPGPWKHDPRCDTILSTNEDWLNSMICKIATGEDAKQELSNARLIAAAPDLLAACKAARDALGLALCGTPSPSYFEQVKADRITHHNLTIEDGLAENSRQIKTDSAAALALINAAIAKAEGN